jgi:hypothetical protein
MLPLIFVAYWLWRRWNKIASVREAVNLAADHSPIPAYSA